MSHRSFCSLPTRRPWMCQNVGNKDGTSSRDPLETSEVSAPDISTMYGIRTSTRQGSFQGTSWASTDYIPTTPPDLPSGRTSVHPVNQSKTAHRAGYRGTRNHHQATRTGRLETTPVRRPRVGQRAIPLLTPTLMPILVP